MTPLRDLVHHTLRPFHRPLTGPNDYGLTLQLFDDARLAGLEALVGAGLGLDLLAGERILAAAQMVERPKGHEHRLSLVITDRWTALSGWSSLTGPAARDRLRFAVPHTQLMGVEVKKAGLIDNAHIALQSMQGIHKLEFAELQQPLGEFFMRLTQTIAPAHRCEAPCPAVVASEADPTGRENALSGLWFDDPQARQLLRQLELATSSGMPVEVALDFVGRVVLAHRASASAPCMRDGLWLSPLTAQDLGFACTSLFGAPAYHYQPRPGVDQLSFHFDPRRNGLDAAITALGVASFMTLGVGFNPSAALVNAAFERPQVTAIMVELQQHGPTSAYRLMTPSGSLETADSLLAMRCHQAVIASAYPLLAQRIAHGWAVPPSELARAPQRVSHTGRADEGALEAQSTV